MSGKIQTAPLPEVLEAFKAGKMVVMLDDADRENEGDLVIATSKASERCLSMMMSFGRGLICVSIDSSIASRLNLPLQVLNNNSPFNTPFTVSIDHKDVAQSGVTAKSRLFTMQSLLLPASKASDFVSPGHVFPLVANEKGVLGRRGQTEGSYDLARLAGLEPSGIICEILNPDGSMARGEALERFAKEHEVLITSVDDIARFRMISDTTVRQVAANSIETDYGRFQAYVFESDVDGKEHMALVYGDPSNTRSPNGPMVRVHSECLTGDVFESRRCDCGEQLSRAMRQIVKEGEGVLLYLRQEGRGIGLGNKLKAYALQDLGHDTVEANLKLGFKADQRDFAVAARILNHLNISKIRLLTNNPQKIDSLTSNGITVSDRLPVKAHPDEYSDSYLRTKREKMGHLL